jgi:GT2 family glycosyltransferase
MIDVSIIIINYNTLDLTLDCINSIYNNTTEIKFEIIVVDNDSKFCPLDTIKDIFKEVIVIKSNINLGFGKANNLGSEYASGKYLFFLNSDTILINNAINILYRFLEDDKENRIAAAGGNLFSMYDKPNYSYSMYFPSIWRIILYRLRINKIIHEEYFNHSLTPKKVQIIIGADLLIKREIFNKIDRFDPFYFMYVEDGDLQYQLYKRNYFVYNVPKAKIKHLQGASSTTGEKMIMEVDSYYYFFKKNKKSPVLYISIEFLFALLYYIIFTLLQNKVKQNNYKMLIIHIFNEYIYTKAN